MIKDNTLKLISAALLIFFCLSLLPGKAQDLPPKFQKKIDEYKKLIKTHQYTKAINLCENALKRSRLSSSSPEVTEEQVKIYLYEAQLGICLDEAQRQKQLFNKMIKDLTSGPEKKEMTTPSGAKVIIDKVDDSGLEGRRKGRGSGRYTMFWSNLPAKTIYALFQIGRLKTDEKFNLAIWCFNHELTDEAEELLRIIHKEQPEKIGIISELLAQKRNIPLPEEGFSLYKKQWVTPEDKEHIEQGHIKHDGKWMTKEEMMLAKGYVKYKDKWVTKAKMKKIQAKLKAQEELKNRFAPKGVIDKPGADFEELSWDQAREKKTKHYIIKSNLSEEALNDICYVMECLYTNFRDLFKYKRTHREKLRVFVPRKRETYHQLGGPGGSLGVYMHGGSEGKRLMTFYQFLEVGQYYVVSPLYTTKVLLHEGTHQFMHIICSVNPPIWINEGLATYYEASQFDGKELQVNLVNRERLHTIKRMIQAKKHRSLRDFINIDQANYHSPQYAQGWSIVYFLINGEDGKYVPGFNKYIEELRKRPVTMDSDRNRKRHIKLFEKVFRGKIDIIGAQWEEYILALE